MSRYSPRLYAVKAAADQWAAHSALAAKACPKTKKFKAKRRDEMKARFLAALKMMAEQIAEEDWRGR